MRWHTNFTQPVAHMVAELRIPRPGPLARPLRRRLDRNTVTLGELLAANLPVRAVLVRLQSLPPSSLMPPSSRVDATMSRCRAAEFRFFATARNESGRQPNTEPTHHTHQTPLFPTLFNTSPTLPTPPPTDPSHGRASPMFEPAGWWYTAKRTTLRVWITSNRTGPLYGRRVCARGGLLNRLGTRVVK